jgi:hypothetical protein
MANILGSITSWGNVVKSVCILAPATVANNAVPTLDTDGIPVYPDRKKGNVDGHAFPNTPPRTSTLQVKATVTAGQTLVGTLTLWGYHPALARWIEIPTNGGTAVTPVALAETDTDVITFFQRYEDLGHFSRLYLQLTGIGGTGASFEAWLTTGLENT